MIGRSRRRQSGLWVRVAGLVTVLCATALLWRIGHQEQLPREPYLRGLFRYEAPRDYDGWTDPPALKVTRAHRRAWPRDGFAFRLSFDTGFEINTLDGTITKDMGLKPDTTIAVLLTEEELTQFHEDVLAVHFFDYTEPHPPFGAQGLADPPAPPRTFRTIEMCVQAGGV